MVFKDFLAAVTNAVHAKSLKRALTSTLKTNTTEERLQSLHALEFNFPDEYRFPWALWRYLPTPQKTTYNDAVKTLFQPAAAAEYEQDILEGARNCRSSNSAADLPDSLFPSLKECVERAHTLTPHLRLEYLLQAFFLRQYKICNHLAHDLLKETSLFKSDNDEAKIRDLVFDIYCMATIRINMQDFVEQPGHLIQALETLATAPYTQDILGKKRATALCFEANLRIFKGDIDGAVIFYEKASKTEGFNSFIFRQMHLVKNVPDVIADHKSLEHWYDNQQNTDICYRHNPSGEHVVLVSCNPKYFYIYGKLFAQVVSQNTPSQLIHFHIVDGNSIEPKIEASMLEWETKYDVRLNWTFETNNILKTDPTTLTAVASCSRYIFLPEYLKHYDSISVSDIDGWFTKPIKKSADYKDDSIKISSWIWRENIGHWRLPWSNVSAGHFSVRADIPGRTYARLVALYIKSLFRTTATKGKSIFYADQTAMFLCLHYMQKKQAITFDFLVSGFSQSTNQSFHNRDQEKQKALAKKLSDKKT